MLLHLGEEEWHERRDAEEGEAQAHFDGERSAQTTSSEKTRDTESSRQERAALRPKRLEEPTSAAQIAP